MRPSQWNHDCISFLQLYKQQVSGLQRKRFKHGLEWNRILRCVVETWGSERALSKLRRLQRRGAVMKSANPGPREWDPRTTFRSLHPHPSHLFKLGVLTLVLTWGDEARWCLIWLKGWQTISQSAALKASGGTAFSARVRLRTEGGEELIALTHGLLWLCAKHTDCAGDEAKCRNFNFIWIVWWETGQENSRKACHLLYGCSSRSLFVSLQW